MKPQDGAQTPMSVLRLYRKPLRDYRLQYPGPLIPEEIRGLVRANIDSASCDTNSFCQLRFCVNHIPICNTACSIGKVMSRQMPPRTALSSHDHATPRRSAARGITFRWFCGNLLAEEGVVCGTQLWEPRVYICGWQPRTTLPATTANRADLPKIYM